MKRLICIGFMAFLTMAYGCQSMDAFEKDMTKMLKHIEIDSLASDQKGKEATEQKTTRTSSTAKKSVDSVAQPVIKSKAAKNSLTIQVFPKGSTVSLMNISSAYSPGMRLPSGEYELKVEYPGYKTYREWIDIEYDLILKVILKKQAEAYMTKTHDPVADTVIPDYEEKPTKEDASVKKPTVASRKTEIVSQQKTKASTQKT